VGLYDLYMGLRLFFFVIFIFNFSHHHHHYYQIKGCHKELLELSTVVENIRAKESWGAMEAQLKNQNN
jgi:hypothetical protein